MVNILLIMVNISGWWYTYPSEKYEFVNGKDYPIPYMKWKIKFMFQTTNQDRFIVRKKHCTKIGAATALHCPYVCHWNHWERENLQKPRWNPRRAAKSSQRDSPLDCVPQLDGGFPPSPTADMIGWWKVASECLQRGGFNRKKVVHLTVKLGIWSKKLVELNWKPGTGNQQKLGPLRLVLVVLLPLLAKKMDGGHVRLKSLPAFKSSKFLQDVNSQQLPAGSRVPSSSGSWSQSAPQHHATQWLHLMVDVVLFRIHMANLGNSLQKNNKLSSAYTFLYMVHNGTYYICRIYDIECLYIIYNSKSYAIEVIPSS